MNSGEIGSVVITGCLGGLGCTLSREFLDSGIHVFGLDNFDPGCASIVHHRYVRDELNKNEKFDFRAHDIRRPIPRELFSESHHRYWFHCVDYAPTRHSYIDPGTAEEILYEALAKQINDFEEDIHVVFIHNITTHNDPENKTREWKKVYDSNQKLKSEFSVHANVHFLELPHLIGKHQSRRTNPVKMFMQFNSGIPVETSNCDNSIIAIDLDRYASTFVQNFDKNIATDSDEQSFSFTNKSALQFLRQRFTEEETEGLLDNVDEKVTQEDENYQVTIKPLLEKIYNHMKTIPHFPPDNWAKRMKKDEKERRAIRRRQHRRKKKNRTK